MSGKPEPEIPRPGPDLAVLPAPPTNLDDETLVVRAQEGDVRSFEVLLRRHEAKMYRLALRLLGVPGDAEDAVQEAFISAWRRLGTFRGDSAFSSWLYRIVTNRCLNMIRSRRPVAPLDPTIEVSDTKLTGAPERSEELAEQVAALRHAVASLPSHQRVCWVLKESDGLSYSEIAQIVGTSPDSVRGRIHRARVHLAEEMRSWL